MVKINVNKIDKFFELANYKELAYKIAKVEDVEYELEFYRLIAKRKGEVLAVLEFQPSSVKFLSGQATKFERQQLMGLMYDFLVATRIASKKKLNEPVVIPSPANLPAGDKKESMILAAAKAGLAPEAVSFESPELDKPIPLRNAQQLGQAVHGTSKTYRVAALSPFYALAVNFTDGDMAVRIEPRDTQGSSGPGEMGNQMLDMLKKHGFKYGVGNHGPYWSIHLAASGIPRERILGAVLMDVGKDFKTRVQSLEELHYVN